MAARRSSRISHLLKAAFVVAPVTGLLVLGTGVLPASAADAPVDMLTNEPVAVLAATTVTNTGPSVVSGDLDLSPGSAITGFGPGTVIAGTTHAADAVAVQAQVDLTTATTDASGRPPASTGLTDLAGLTLVPGVYAGGALSLSGTLVLNGDASSVFIFQASSTLITASNSVVSMTGGATACNVWWVVPSSATLGTASTFVGTILAGASITADTGATVAGRLLASTGQVSLDSNLVTRPVGCTNTTTTGGSGGSGGSTGSAVGGGGASGSSGGVGSSDASGGSASALAATGVSLAPLPAALALGLLGAGLMLARIGARRPSKHRGNTRRA